VLGAILWQAHKPPNFWLKIGAFNLAMAMVAGAFFGIGARALVLAAFDWKRDRRRPVFRLAKGEVFLLLGAFYTVFAWPMLEWDYPARFLVVLTILLPPLMAVIRRSMGSTAAAPKLGARLLSAFLVAVLLVAAVLTLLRAGFITLAGDRVPLLLEVTGETAGRPSGAASPTALRIVAAHHVILWLPSGVPGADLWMEGDRVSFGGRAVLFSHQLNALGFPNLYQFLTVRAAGTQGGSLSEFWGSLPHTGPLAVNSLWRPIQAAILRLWPRAPEGASTPLGIRIIQNQSPYYPLTGPDGQPLKARFLLDLTLEGVPTSRGSSPLEKR
jgi:hypothetical protein